jgi:hypothetical protein
MKQRYKTPVCVQCGRVLKGHVPIPVEVICYFCSNPPFDDNGDENTALKYEDKQ